MLDVVWTQCWPTPGIEEEQSILKEEEHVQCIEMRNTIMESSSFLTDRKPI